MAFENRKLYIQLQVAFQIRTNLYWGDFSFVRGVVWE